MALYTKKEVIRLIKKMPLQHKEKLSKAKIVLSLHKNKWQNVVDDVVELRNQIKEEVKSCVTEAENNWKKRHGVAKN